MAAGPEGPVERAIVRAAERRGGWAPKAGQGIGGFPDRTLFMPGGRLALVEAKTPGEKPGPLQGWVHDRLRRLGFRVVVIDRVEDVEPFFVEWLGE